MVIPDANVLLYAIDRGSRAYRQCRAWLEQAMADPEPIGLSWVVVLAFVRLTTRAGLLERPLTVDQAFDEVEGWLARPQVLLLEPTDRHLAILRGLLTEAGTGGNLTTDAHLAALAIEYRATVVSCDHDFARFRGLRWLNPTV